MKIILLTVGFALLLCGVGGAAYCVTLLYEGTPDCAAAQQNIEALAAAEQQFQSAKNTPAAAQLGEKLENLRIQTRVSRSNCEDSKFQYQAYTALSGIGIFFGALMLGIGRLLHRNRHFGIGFGEH